MVAAGGNQRKTCLLPRRISESGPTDTLSNAKTDPGRARVTHLLPWRLWNLPAGKGVKALFLPHLSSCCQQTLMNKLTWVGSIGAYQQVASRNQNYAFTRLSRNWNERMDGVEGRKRQCMAMWHVCLQPLCIDQALTMSQALF